MGTAVQNSIRSARNLVSNAMNEHATGPEYLNLGHVELEPLNAGDENSGEIIYTVMVDGAPDDDFRAVYDKNRKIWHVTHRDAQIAFKTPHDLGVHQMGADDAEDAVKNWVISRLHATQGQPELPGFPEPGDLEFSQRTQPDIHDPREEMPESKHEAASINEVKVPQDEIAKIEAMAELAGIVAAIKKTKDELDNAASTWIQDYLTKKLGLLNNQYFIVKARNQRDQANAASQPQETAMTSTTAKNITEQRRMRNVVKLIEGVVRTDVSAINKPQNAIQNVIEDEVPAFQVGDTVAFSDSGQPQGKVVSTTDNGKLVVKVSGLQNVESAMGALYREDAGDAYGGGGDVPTEVSFERNGDDYFFVLPAVSEEGFGTYLYLWAPVESNEGAGAANDEVIEVDDRTDNQKQTRQFMADGPLYDELQEFLNNNEKRLQDNVQEPMTLLTHGGDNRYGIRNVTEAECLECAVTILKRMNESAPEPAANNAEGSKPATSSFADFALQP